VEFCCGLYPFTPEKQIAEVVGITNTTYLFGELKERYGV
jgi:hypothetical protein